MRIRTTTVGHAHAATVVVDALPGDSPAFVYLHGLSSVRRGEKSDALFELAASLGRACYRFDFRGHGESSGSLDEITLSDLIADTRAVLELAGRAVLVGSSLGGLVAVWTATSWPERTAALVLLSPALGFLPRLADCPRVGETVLVPGEREIRLGWHALEDASRYDEDTLGPSLRVPTMIVHGARDETVPATHSRKLFEAILHPARELWIVPDGDHRLNGPIHEIYARMLAFLDPGRRR